MESFYRTIQKEKFLAVFNYNKITLSIHLSGGFQCGLFRNTLQNEHLLLKLSHQRIIQLPEYSSLALLPFSIYGTFSSNHVT